MDSVSPVWSEREVENEKVCALDQPEYLPIIILPVQFYDGTIASSVRFRPTDAEREQLTNGADLVFTEMTFGRPFTPIHVVVCMPNRNPFEEAPDAANKD